MNSRLSSIAGVIMLSLLGSTGAAGDKDGAAAELAKSVQGALAAKSYAFQIDERPGGGTGGPFTGKYAQGEPVFFKSDGIAFYMKGAALVYEQGGTWLRSKTGMESDPLRILGAAAKVRRARLPHEELARLAKGLKGVTKQDEGGQAVYRGALTDKAVKELSPTESRSVARSGVAKVWVNGEGRVTKYALDIRLQGRRGNAEVDGSTTRTVTLSDAGKARVEVPAAARKVLE